MKRYIKCSISEDVVREMACDDFESGHPVEDFGEFRLYMSEEGILATEALWQLYLDTFDSCKEGVMSGSVTCSNNLTDIYTLEVVPEGNDENDQPCSWAVRSQYDDGAGRYHFIWINKYDDNEYIVEDSSGFNRTDGKTYKTLRGAWREAAKIMQRQDESGYYTD